MSVSSFMVSDSSVTSSCRVTVESDFGRSSCESLDVDWKSGDIHDERYCQMSAGPQMEIGSRALLMSFYRHYSAEHLSIRPDVVILGLSGKVN